MSPFFSPFLVASLALLFIPRPANAQVQLRGNSQYGGLLRNVNSGKCIDVFGASTNKNANNSNTPVTEAAISAGNLSISATVNLPLAT